MCIAIAREPKSEFATMFVNEMLQQSSEDELLKLILQGIVYNAQHDIDHYTLVRPGHGVDSKEWTMLQLNVRIRLMEIGYRQTKLIPESDGLGSTIYVEW